MCEWNISLYHKTKPTMTLKLCVFCVLIKKVYNLYVVGAEIVDDIFNCEQ